MTKQFLSLALLLFLAATPVFAKTNRKIALKKAKPVKEERVRFSEYQGGSNFSLFPIRSKAQHIGPHLVIFDSQEAWDAMVRGYPNTLIVGGASSNDPSRNVDLTSVYGSPDFSKQTYMEWIWGDKNSTGYSIRLERIVRAGTLRCFLKVTSPKGGEAVRRAATTPSFSALVDRVTQNPKIEIFLNEKATTFSVVRNPPLGPSGYYEVP
ncbi:MAG: protease complex subunit PrcB family protein [Pseudomonadota bacterium]